MTRAARPRHKWIFVDGGASYYEVPISRRPEQIAQVDWDRICGINDFIIDHVRYDHARRRFTKVSLARGIQEPQRTLDRGRGICADYARLFEHLASEDGYDVRVARSSTLNHAWNVVRLAGRWWVVDVTWNDGDHELRGSRVPTELGSDPDFRRRYLLTTLERERLLLRHGLLSGTHTAHDVEFTKRQSSR